MSAASVQYSFSGHETFPFRYSWLKKGFDAASDDGDEDGFKRGPLWSVRSIPQGPRQ